ncbi:MAG: hypothetical protein IPJ33_20710 [Gammaproteobacteria bacterium]|nr:hypothetical protein [Gammaproteobacteria bacterium]
MRREAEKSIEEFNADNEGFFAIRHAKKEAEKLRDLSGAYTLLDRDNTYYICDGSGTVTAYGDVDPNDATSAIEIKRVFKLPEPITGLPRRHEHNL